MSESLSLFEPETELLEANDLPLTHPYTRYGLAVALFQGRLGEHFTEVELREALAQAIETGLGHFRMRTPDDPQLTRLLHFYPVKLEELEGDPSLVQGALAPRGIYLYPSVITTDKTANLTFQSAVAIVAALRGDTKLDASQDLRRSFAPTTSKINNGTASQSPPKGTLLEAAAALVTTLTPLKPAAWAIPPGIKIEDEALSRINTGIIPDLPLPQLRDFIRLFSAMLQSDVEGNSLEAELPELRPVPQIDADSKSKSRSHKNPRREAAPKSEFRRPRLHNGNYPFAPDDAKAFGGVGLLGAIGRWAYRADMIGQAAQVLESMIDKPLYVISNGHITQVRFSHHVVQLAQKGHLSEMVEALWSSARLLTDREDQKVNRDSKEHGAAYRIFYLKTSRFLQQFNASAFADFLATRVEYPALVQPLFEEYFMQTQKIPADIVYSAQAYGQWLNRIAYLSAKEDVERQNQNRQVKWTQKELWPRVDKAKAGILVGLESVAMSSKSPQEMLARVQSQVGRLLHQEAPPEAARFINAVNIGELEPPLPQHLLMTYLRLRASGKENSGVQPTGEEILGEDPMPQS